MSSDLTAKRINLSDIPRLFPEKEDPTARIGLFVNGVLNTDQDLNELIKEVNRCSALILVDGGANNYMRLSKICESQKSSLIPDPICLIGDLDSIEDQALHYLEEKFPKMQVMKFSRDKDFTDLEAAIQVTKLDKIAQAVLFCADGGRVDHELSVLMLMHRKEYRGKLSAVTSAGKILQTVIPNQVQKISPKEVDFDKASSLLERLNAIFYLLSHPAPFQIKGKNEILFTVGPKQQYTFTAKIAQTISLIPLGGSAEGVKTDGLYWNLSTPKFDNRICGVSNIAISEKVSVSVEKGVVLCVVNDFIDREMHEILGSSDK